MRSCSRPETLSSTLAVFLWSRVTARSLSGGHLDRARRTEAILAVVEVIGQAHQPRHRVCAEGLTGDAIDAGRVGALGVADAVESALEVAAVEQPGHERSDRAP